MATPSPSSDSLSARIAELTGDLSAAQSRVARLVSEAPSVVAFGTVAAVAQEAATSPQTVLRLAARLGHEGFPGLQDEVRSELVARLPPAAARIRRRPGNDLVGEVLSADARNVAVSLDVDGDQLAAAVELLSDLDRRVVIVAADSWAGVGILFHGHLSQLRADVSIVDGPPPRVAREVSHLAAGDVLVALDVRRYERWVVDAVDRAVVHDVAVIGITDAATSPVYARAAPRFVVDVASPSPFDSATGAVALLHLLATEVAGRLRRSSRDRLDATEAAWAQARVLLDD